MTRKKEKWSVVTPVSGVLALPGIPATAVSGPGFSGPLGYNSTPTMTSSGTSMSGPLGFDTIIAGPLGANPATTMPIEKKNYIRSVDGNYLIFKEGGWISYTSDYTKATPISIGSAVSLYLYKGFYPILTETGKYISASPTNTSIAYTDGFCEGFNGSPYSYTFVLTSTNYPTTIYLFGSTTTLPESLMPENNTGSNIWSVVYL